MNVINKEKHYFNNFIKFMINMDIIVIIKKVHIIILMIILNYNHLFHLLKILMRENTENILVKIMNIKLLELEI